MKCINKSLVIRLFIKLLYGFSKLEKRKSCEKREFLQSVLYLTIFSFAAFNHQSKGIYNDSWKITEKKN